MIPDRQKREFMTTPPRKGLFGAVVLIGGLAWSYNYLKRVYFIPNMLIYRKVIFAEEWCLLLQVVFSLTLWNRFYLQLLYLYHSRISYINWSRGIFKTINHRSGLGIMEVGTRTIRTIRTIRAIRPMHIKTINQIETTDDAWSGHMFPASAGGTARWTTALSRDRTSSAMTMMWCSSSQQRQQFYEDFEDFFKNAQYQYQDQSQRQGWNYEDVFNGGRTGMSRQEAYRVLGLK